MNSRKSRSAKIPQMVALRAPSRKSKNAVQHKTKTTSRRNRGKGKSLGAILDTAENVAGYLPGAIRTIRGIFNPKEVDYATPASFACVRNNETQMLPEEPVSHPTLGVSGIRIRGSQPLCQIVSSIDAITGVITFFSGRIDAIQGANTIFLNPQMLGGPLSVHAYLYDRYVIRKLAVRFTTYQPTTTLGVFTMCIEKDVAALTALGFDTARMVTPNVTFPVRIPKAELDYRYDGPELFYCLDNSATGSLAQSRQQVQAVLEGYDAIPPSTALNAGWLDIEYEIDFFEPVAPSALIGSSDLERRALQFVRSQFAKPQTGQSMLKPPSMQDVEMLVRKFQSEKLSAAAGADSCARP